MESGKEGAPSGRPGSAEKPAAGRDRTERLEALADAVRAAVAGAGPRERNAYWSAEMDAVAKRLEELDAAGRPPERPAGGAGGGGG